MNDTIEPNWKDEILNGEAKYRKRKNGEIIDDDFTLEQIAEVIQTPTALNKANLETPIGEIRMFVNKRSDSKYLLCDGSRIYIEDYPELAERLPHKYTYDEIDGDTSYSYITEIKYFEEKSLYIMVRMGISEKIGYGIFTSLDGENWTVRHTSGTSYYNSTPSIQYMKELNLFIAIESHRILTSEDGYNWILRKSTNSSNYYYRSPATYSTLLGKALIVEYNTKSTYYTYLYSTTDFVNFEEICRLSGNINDVFCEKIIEADGRLITTGRNLNGYSTILYISNDNGATFKQQSSNFNVASCVNFGEYWYSCYTQYNSGSTICKTKDFETFEIVTEKTQNTSLLGVINGYLFYRINGVLKREDLNGNITEFPDTDNLQYLPIRKEYIKISGGKIHSSDDLLVWNQVDDIPIEDYSITEVSVCTSGKIFAVDDDTSSYKNIFFSYDDNQINLPIFDNCYAYVKACDEGEG